MEVLPKKNSSRISLCYTYKRPFNYNPYEIFAEICVGMGEALVVAYEAQSLSFSYNKEYNNYDIKSFPNKSIVLKNSGLIFRSDSNTEYLEGFF